MGRLVMGLVLLAIAAGGWIAAIGKFYKPSETELVSAQTREVIARTLQVTSEQRAELNRATRICDEVTFGLFGLLVGGIIAACCGRYSSQSGLIRAGLTGAALGALAGALGGYIGHSFQAHVAWVENPTVHSVLRLIAMFLPLAVVIGSATALSGSWKRDAADTIAGAVLGLLIAAAVYGISSDSNALTRESETDILPKHVRNQAMLFVSLSALMALMITAQTMRKPRTLEPKPDKP